MKLKLAVDGEKRKSKRKKKMKKKQNPGK